MSSMVTKSLHAYKHDVIEEREVRFVVWEIQVTGRGRFFHWQFQCHLFCIHFHGEFEHTLSLNTLTTTLWTDMKQWVRFLSINAVATFFIYFDLFHGSPIEFNRLMLVVANSINTLVVQSLLLVKVSNCL
jgi:hypothetical protein